MFKILTAEKYTIGTAFLNKNLNNSIIFKNYFKFDKLNKNCRFSVFLSFKNWPLDNHENVSHFCGYKMFGRLFKAGNVHFEGRILVQDKLIWKWILFQSFKKFKKKRIMERKQSSGFNRIFTVAFDRLFQVRLGKCWWLPLKVRKLVRAPRRGYN